MSITPASIQLQSLSEALKRASSSISAVAAKIVTPDKIIKIAIAAAQRTPLLLECNTASIVRAVIQSAELGLVPGSALNHAYLVPFKNKQGTYDAQLIISAQGFAEIAYRSGLVSFIISEVVYRGDDFEYELGLTPVMRHVPRDETIDPSDITHAYMVVGLKDGTKAFRVMTRKGIDRIMARSPGRGASGPWATDYAEMARKTVIKNGMKFVPKSIEVARAVAVDNAFETGDLSMLDFDTPDASPLQAISESTVSKVAGKAAKIASELLGDDADDLYSGPVFMDDETVEELSGDRDE